jgi:hypothetical protein
MIVSGMMGAAVGRGDEKSARQRTRRIPYKVNVVMRPREDVELLQGEVCNLSTGGMFIKTMLPLKPGTVFDVEVPMHPLNYIGPVRVLWTRNREEGPDQPYGMAVEWVDLTMNQKKLLYSQIDSHVRSGGMILLGNHDGRREGQSPAGVPFASTGASPDRTKLIVGLAIAVVVVLVVLFVLR